MKQTEYSILHTIVTELNVSQQIAVARELNRRLNITVSFVVPELDMKQVTIEKEMYLTLKKFIDDGAKLAAVKHYKLAADLGLKEAKYIIDEMISLLERGILS